MSASHAPALDAVAFQLTAALDHYEQDVGRLAASWIDIELYREVSHQVEQIRMYSSALPQARAQWVELLIAHAELMHCLWQTHPASGAEPKESVAAVRSRNSAAVAALRRRCVDHLVRQPGPPA